MDERVTLTFSHEELRSMARGIETLLISLDRSHDAMCEVEDALLEFKQGLRIAER